MSRSRVTAVLGVALLLVLSAWALVSVTERREPVDLGPVMTVPTASLTPSEIATEPTSPKPTPSQSETGPAPAQEPTIGVTTSAESPGTGGATPVSKAPVPVAGDDDDDDDGIDDGDERDDDLDDDDNDDG